MKIYNLSFLCLIGSALAGNVLATSSNDNGLQQRNAEPIDNMLLDVAKRDDGDDTVDVSALLDDIESIIDEIKATYGIEKRGTKGLDQDDLVTALTDLVSSLADALGLDL